MFRRLVLPTLILALLPTAASAQIVNGDFSEGLDGWEVIQPAPSKPNGPAHGWQIHGFNQMATFLVAGTETPTEEGHIEQTFTCGEPGPGTVCEITVDYRLINHEGDPAAGRIKLYVDDVPLFTDGTLSPQLEWYTALLQVPCGEHTIKLCLEIDTGISAWTANFDNAVATCRELVPVEPTTWGRVKRRLP